MELVYLYIQEAYGEEYDLHLDFSSNTKIRFDKETQKFSVETIENGYPSDFFGDNIKNIIGVFGVNGIGKTTLFNILSLQSSRLIYTGQWLIVYKINNNYYFEGNFDQMLHSLFRNMSFIRGDIINGDLQVKKEKEEAHIHESSLCYLSLFNTGFTHTNLEMFKREDIYNAKNLSILNLLSNSHFNELFDISSKARFEMLLNKPNYVENAVLNLSAKLSKTDNEKIVSFLKRLDDRYIEYQSSKKFSYMANKENFISKMCWIIYDTLFHFLVSLLKKVVHDDFFHELLALIIRAIDRYSDDKNLQNILYLVEGMQDVSIRFNISLSNGDQLSESNLKEIILELFRKLTEFNQEFFISDLSLEIEKDHFSMMNKNLNSLLTSINYFMSNFYSEGSGVFHVSFGEFSAGEFQLLELFSKINDGIEKNKDLKLIIILLDEYEKHLHPEWSRLFLFYLKEFLKIYNTLNFQVILSSHSPYLISDLPKENIRLITKNEITGKREVSIPKHGFASNYYDILSDSFFLEDTIGEFAKQKINSWISELNQLEKNIDEYKDDKTRLEKIDEIKKLIMIVDDQFIRNKLLELAEDVKNKIIKNADKSLQESLIDAEIAKLEAMKKRLRTEEKND